MEFLSLIISVCSFSLIFSSSLVLAQQSYARKATTNCSNTENSTTVLGYTCNGVSNSCQSYPIFRALSPQNTVKSISSLLNADATPAMESLTLANPSQVAQINSVSENTTFDTNKEFIYPFTTLLVPLKEPPSSTQTLTHPPPPPSPPCLPSSSSSGSNGNSKKTWIYVVTGVIGGIVFVLRVFSWCSSRGRVLEEAKINFEALEKSPRVGENYSFFLESLSSIALSIKIYNFVELKLVTNDFSPKCWIKGSVYRGTFNGDFAAIKKMNGDVSEEISGVCFHDGHCYFVYEYAANGPLSDWIYKNRSGEKVQIALDAATGLNYLHRYTSPPQVHKNINSSNVLLDDDFRAKIANLGLTRSAVLEMVTNLIIDVEEASIEVMNVVEKRKKVNSH
ncbi:Serine-threonine/tyrosine-protein kinase, catalytic domain [Dillenia turbinata]|uniref:Serine-threonine/tyrosine-protein kinase, catalytic domain n=1 Tax=Dillenia turbinata TaxID=194707 RepID=A0AAN8V7N9_9MAGN